MDVDVALVQEACGVPDEVLSIIDTGPREHWDASVWTYYTRGESPRTATRQLDYVFASRGFHESVRARALNEVNEWGPSDHCRMLIEVD